MSDTTNIDAITRALADTPDGATAKDLATVTGLSPATAQKVLTAMETAGTATRTAGATNGGRRNADTWRPATTDVSAEVAPADDATTTVTVTDGDPAPSPDAPEPAPTQPRKPDLKVMLMAGVLEGRADGISTDEAISESGFTIEIGDRILAAMEAAGAAFRLPITDDGIDLWKRGTADVAAVDPTNVPTFIRCATCGHDRPVRRTIETPRRSAVAANGGSRVNNNGAQRLGKGELERLIEAWVRSLGTGHEVSPVMASHAVGRGAGGCSVAMDGLTRRGVLFLAKEAPRRFALAADAPQPSPEVVALMTRPVIDTTSFDPNASVAADPPTGNTLRAA
jgi:hypothetical protein